jgi:ribonuclease HI
MELEAVLRAIESLPGPLHIHSDSTYVVNCFNDRWYDGWLKRGWKNSQKKPVANRDLWEPLIDLYLERAEEIDFTWVKGHSGNVWNERADELAVAAADAVVAKTAVAAVTRRATQEPGATEGSGPVAPWPTGRALWVTGVTELSDDQRAGLVRVVEGLDPAGDVLVTGLRRGAELVAAEAARSRRIELAVVLPFADPAARWPSAERDRFESVRSAASFEVVLDGNPATPGVAVGARNRWVLDHVIGIIVVGDDEAATAAEAEGLTVISIS